jgi:hypothetical protein
VSIEIPVRMEVWRESNWKLRLTNTKKQKQRYNNICH